MRRNVGILILVAGIVLPSVGIGKGIPEEVEKLVKAEEPETRIEGCYKLKEFGKEGIGYLKELLSDSSLMVRYAAADALAQIGSSEVKEIFRGMAEKDGETRRIGIVGLALCGDIEFGEEIVKGLESSNWQVRWICVYSLGKLRYIPTLERLRELAKEDPVSAVKDEAKKIVKEIEREGAGYKELVYFYKKFPENIDVKWFFAEKCIDKGDIKKAIKLWEEIFNGDPENRSGYTPKAGFYLGYWLGRTGEFKKAIEVLGMVRNRFPEFEEMGKLVYCLALGYLYGGNVERAKSLLKEIIRDYPYSPVRTTAEALLDEIER